MTVSTHVYRAWLIGAPDIELDVRGGSITLDSSRAPHVTASLAIAIPDESVLIALDPRLNKRVRLTADAVFPTFAQSRTFNLGLRESAMRQSAAVVDVTLESDEALLRGYAPLTDDYGAFPLQNSLRGIVNYVLGKAIPGAALAASPGGDANVTTYSDATNLAVNPRGGVNTASWGATAVAGTVSVSRITGDPTYGTALRFDWTAAQGSQVFVEHSGIPVTPGKKYVMAMTARSSLSIPSGANVGVEMFNNAGIQVGGSPVAPILIYGADVRAGVSFTAPPDASRAHARLYLPNTPSAGLLIVSGLMFREQSPDPGDGAAYWDGDTVDTATYQYSWSAAAHGSSTVRKALVERPPGALVWRAGASALEFLHPLVQASGFRLVCDEARVWTLRSANYVAPGTITIVQGQDLVDGEGVLARESDWFDAQVTRYTWNDANGISQERIDSWALTGAPTRVNLVEIESSFPGVGRSQYAVKRAQGRGRVVTATKVSDWSARAEQGVSVLLAGAPTQTGLIDSVAFSLDNDEMTVTTRTADTLNGSIDLLPGVIDALAGVIDAL